MVQGGTKVNMIPDRCTLQIDCRLGKEDSPEQMEDRVRSILRKIGERSGCQISHEILTSCPAGWCERTLFRVRQMQKTAEKYGSNYGKLSIFPASCEAGILSEKCKVPAVILGPGSITQAHTANEYISLEQLKAGARIYMELFENFLKGGEKNV